MFQDLKVIPITALKSDSKEPLSKETVSPLRMGIVTRMPSRRIAAAHSSGTPVPQLSERIAQTRGKILSCLSAALTTAATHSRAFPVAVAEICKETHS